MKKYKLIKEYPNNNNIGLIVWNDNDQYLWKNEGPYESRIFSKSTVENFPEFWEEVKEEPKYHYLITAFRCKYKPNPIFKIDEEGFYTEKGYQRWALDEMLNGDNGSVRIGDWGIYSVKNTKGVEWTVGDEWLCDNEWFTIESFATEMGIHGKLIMTAILRGGGNMAIDGLEKTEKPKTPIFVSADGIEIFEPAQKLYSVAISRDFETNDNFQVGFMLSTDRGENRVWKHFVMEKNRQEYIDNNKPKYSLVDIENAYNKTDSPTSSPLFQNFKSILKQLGK